MSGEPVGSGFPATHVSAVLRTRSEDVEVRARALETLVGSYWKPVYKYIRIKWSASTEDARDFTQGFFARAIEKGFFEKYEPSKARFRTYLRTCLDGYIANERRGARRAKRGGDVQIVSLDFETAEGELRQRALSHQTDLDEYFYREWARSLFAIAVEAFREACRASGKEVHFALFERYDLDGADDPASRPTYQDLARTFSLPVTQVTNTLAAARRDFRRIVLAKLREVTGSDEEFRAEARDLLGVDLS